MLKDLPTEYLIKEDNRLSDLIKRCRDEKALIKAERELRARIERIWEKANARQIFNYDRELIRNMILEQPLLGNGTIVVRLIALVLPEK